MKAAQIIDDTSLDRVLKLLNDSKLPYHDVNLTGNLFYSYEDEEGNFIGAGGLELYGSYSLLRSVVIAKEHRGKRYGQAIVIDLLQRARGKSISSVYLLTETAAEFFRKLGFKNIARENVPSNVRASAEFTSVCPVSASCMEYEINAGKA
jgi:amino-acid N-acetyltransferase